MTAVVALQILNQQRPLTNPTKSRVSIDAYHFLILQPLDGRRRKSISSALKHNVSALNRDDILRPGFEHGRFRLAYTIDCLLNITFFTHFYSFFTYWAFSRKRTLVTKSILL